MTDSDRAPIRRAYIDGPWGQVHYRVAGAPRPGNRPPLILLHQTPKSGWEYEPLMPQLGTDRVVIAPDTPGYGASDAPPGPVRIDDYADGFLRLMADLAAAGVVDAGPFDAMGMHTGSLHATQMALAGGDKVRRIILLGLASYDAETRAKKLEGLKSYARPKADLSHIEAVWKIMEKLFDPRTTPEWRHKSLAENLRAGGDMSNAYAAVYRYDFQKALGEVTNRVLVISPDDDLAAFTPVEAKRLRNHTLVSIPGAKHGLLELETERMVGIVRDFLDREP
jgi:pimeloyl-ACP methyl ester carboxylesterase